jgi:hypothetical protein
MITIGNAAELLRFMNSLEKFSAPIPKGTEKARGQQEKMRRLEELNRTLKNAEEYLTRPQYLLCERLYRNIVGEKLSWKG